MKKKLKEYLTKYPRAFSILKIIYYPLLITKIKLKHFPITVCKYVFVLFPIQKNKIVFCNFYGKGFGDNGKYIVEEIIKQGLDYDVVWLLRKELIGKAKIPTQVRIIAYGGVRGLYELATAKLWIDNCRKKYYSHKKKNQYYIQTWHGSFGIKKCEKDVEDKLSEKYVKAAKMDSKMADLFLSNGNFISGLYKKSFWYDGEILESGSPRNDIMFQDRVQVRKKVCQYFNLSDETKIAIYAPSFRKSYDANIFNLDYEGCMNALKEKYDGEWVMLVRLHPNISERADELRYDNKTYNATYYEDMQELLAAADILISDYSSSMIDFALKGYPCFLYVPDIEDYMKDRDFYFKLDELPFQYGINNEELVKVILGFDNVTYMAELLRFLELNGIREDGYASYRVVEKIKEII